MGKVLILAMLTFYSPTVSSAEASCDNAWELEITLSEAMESEAVFFEDCDYSSLLCQSQVKKHRRERQQAIDTYAGRAQSAWLRLDQRCGTRLAFLMDSILTRSEKLLDQFNARYPIPIIETPEYRARIIREVVKPCLAKVYGLGIDTIDITFETIGGDETVAGLISAQRPDKKPLPNSDLMAMCEALQSDTCDQLEVANSSVRCYPDEH